MQHRPLGRSGLACAPLAFGGNVFGWTADEATSFRLLDEFVDAAFNLIDTADVYSMWVEGNQGGESETIIGNWLAKGGKRERVLVATKVGFVMDDGKVGGNLTREHILASCDESLRRLRTDVIDLYQSHREDAATPHEETLGAYADLIKAGKVRAIGCSNFEPATLRAALACSAANGLPRYETLQPLYNLHDRAGFEAELQGLCLDEGIGVIPFYALAAGFLTGKYRTDADVAGSARGFRAKTYMTDRGFRIVAALESVAERLHATPGQVAVAWVMTRPAIAAPIASGRTVEQVRDLLAATKLRLDAESLHTLETASA
ncbi:MAG: aldo/keto reductase [Betaproteobacteria bacterium]|nr:aldo/keto reductase [Betaproteobacteria bacterium]